MSDSAITRYALQVWSGAFLGQCNSASCALCALVQGCNTAAHEQRQLQLTRCQNWILTARLDAPQHVQRGMLLRGVAGHASPSCPDAHIADDRHLQVRHGAVLGLAEVVKALADLGHKPAEGVQAQLADLPQQVVAAKLLRGKGGDVMRAAYCR